MSEKEKKKRSLAQKGKPKNPLYINHKAKTVYMYDVTDEVFIMASSTMDAVKIASAYGYDICDSSIQDCAKNRKRKCKNFICSYDLEELKQKIQQLKHGEPTN